MKLYIEEELVALGFERNFIPPKQRVCECSSNRI